SGSAALLELGRTLQSLIQRGKLPPPKRSIRLLLVPEMTGTYAYLATHEGEIPHMVAGVNLDMVGQNQELCGSVFIIEETPAATPSFATDLLERMREEWMAQAQNLSSSSSYPLFRHTVTPFSGGSDHYILSDPTVGVPTPMLIQWPDKFYHTSEDTLDKVDPHMLATLGGLATTYAYFVANAGPREVDWLGHEMLARFKARLARCVQDLLTEALTAKNGEELAQAAARLAKKAEFIADRQREALRSLLRLSPEVEWLVHDLQQAVNHAVQQETERANRVLQRHAQQLGLPEIPKPPLKEADEWEKRAATMVPTRLFRGPVSSGAYMYKLTPQEKEEAYAWLKEHRRQYYGMSTV
ncbi:MAG: M28 family peptidase, partial [Chloroflexi bacterium]|nr:M28 family peptidase [Chloroflexota bacterium]